MKTMIKQRGFFAVLAVALLITAVLITTCSDPLGGGSLVQRGNDNDDVIHAPAGMGILKLKFIDGRTILPDLTTPLSLQGLAYTITVGGLTDPVCEGVTYSALSSLPAIMVQGGVSHTITVTAWNGPGETGGVVLGGSASVLVLAGQTGTANVTLYPKQEGEGTFSWNCTLTTDASFSISVIDLNGTIPAPAVGTNPIDNEPITFPLTGVTNRTGSVILESGFYRVITSSTLVRYQDKGTRDILHVYDNATSDFTENLTLNRNVWVVTYDTTSGEDDTFTADVNNGLTTSAPTGSYTHEEDLYFGGWCTEIDNDPNLDYDTGDVETLWDGFGTFRFYDDLTLYAAWVGTTEGTLAFTLLPGLKDSGAISGTATMSIGQGTGTVTIILTFNGPGHSDIEWWINGTDHIDNNDGQTTLEISNDRTTYFGSYLNQGRLPITVESRVGTTYYSARFNLVLTK